MAETLGGVIAALIVALAVAAALFDLVGHLSRGVRVSVLVMAAGLVWGGIGRFLRLGVGPGDVLFLAGLLGLLVCLWWRPLSARIDSLDGRPDGRFRFPYP